MQQQLSVGHPGSCCPVDSLVLLEVEIQGCTGSMVSHHSSLDQEYGQLILQLLLVECQVQYQR